MVKRMRLATATVVFELLMVMPKRLVMLMMTVMSPPWEFRLMAKPRQEVQERLEIVPAKPEMQKTGRLAMGKRTGFDIPGTA